MFQLSLPSVHLWSVRSFVSRPTLPYTIKETTVWGVMARHRGRCGHRNCLIGNTGFCLCGMVQSPVARHRVFQQPPPQSRWALPPSSTWWKPLCWVRGHVGEINGSIISLSLVTYPNIMMWISCLVFININLS